jgi:hypothetical protein
MTPYKERIQIIAYIMISCEKAMLNDWIYSTPNAK